VLASAAAVAITGGLPLAVMAFSLWRAGGYVAPHASWRSNPGGIDLATFVLGNPQHPLWGGWVRSTLELLHINRMENAGWLGIAPMVLVWWAIRHHRDHMDIRRWGLIGALFLLWALGPWLHVAGVNTGVLLPENFFAYVPLLSNARIPGRAMAVVFVALALICAHVTALIRPDRQRAALLAVALVIGIDYLPAPFPLSALPVPGIYRSLGGMPAEGIVCELPIGYRDGFGMAGRFDDRLLLNQMEHHHPIVGGFVARIPPRIIDGYSEMPVVRSLFLLSAGQPADARDVLPRQAASDALKRIGIRYVVLDRESAPARLIDYVDSTLALQLLHKEGERELYEISEAARPPAAPSR
jgi:hypothetical protein